jgi:hypothetical protein
MPMFKLAQVSKSKKKRKALPKMVVQAKMTMSKMLKKEVRVLKKNPKLSAINRPLHRQLLNKQPLNNKVLNQFSKPLTLQVLQKHKLKTQMIQKN